MKNFHNDLQIEEDLKHQNSAWRFQRIGMAALVLLIIVSLLGLLGNGPLSSASIESSGGKFKVELQSIIRLYSNDVMNIAFNEDLYEKDTLRLLISKTFIQAIEIQDIKPAPAEEKDAGDNIEFSFLKKEVINSGLVKINYKFRRYGLEEYSLSVKNEHALIKQMVWP